MSGSVTSLKVLGLVAADALGRLSKGAVDDQKRGEGSPHRIRKRRTASNDGYDDPHADEGRGHEGGGILKARM